LHYFKIKAIGGNKMKKSATKVLAVVLTLVFLVSLLTACGGGITNGRYTPTTVGAPYTFLQFNGNQLTIGLMGGMSSTGSYTLNNGTLTLSAQGQSFSFDVNIVDNRTLVIDLFGMEFEYVRQ
jgi:hypothetical protein